MKNGMARLHFWLTFGETITWHPSAVASSSSVSRARFVTAGAIDLKLCTCMYVTLGRVTHRPNFGPVWFLVWPPGGQNRKHLLAFLVFGVNGLLTNKSVGGGSWVRSLLETPLPNLIPLWPCIERMTWRLTDYDGAARSGLALNTLRILVMNRSIAWPPSRWLGESFFLEHNNAIHL
jgi:hypothetical protein